MAYEYYNPNPFQLHIDDCMVRALSKVLGIPWEMASVLLCNATIKMGLTENDKAVFMAVLRENNFDREAISNDCPDCYTAEDFCVNNPKGTFVLDFGSHVAAVVDGVIYDTADIRKMIPHFFWRKREVEE